MLDELQKEFIDFKIEVKEFVASLKEWQNQTKTYRQELCQKIDSIKTETREEIDRLCDRLPCKENDVRLRKCETDLATMKGKSSVFGAIGGFISGLLINIFKPR